jgi:hypothetical protein
VLLGFRVLLELWPLEELSLAEADLRMREGSSLPLLPPPTLPLLLLLLFWLPSCASRSLKSLTSPSSSLVLCLSCPFSLLRSLMISSYLLS